MKKTIVITGSSAGIGKTTALLFASKGWNVAATMRNPGSSAELSQLPGIRLYQMDVTRPESVREALYSILSDFGRIDAVVNNAGYGAVGPFEAASEDQIRRQFETNVFGVMTVIREILPHFRQNQAGLIVNISSVGGRITFPLYSLYHGTKWAVEGFSESLAFELRPQGIRIKLIEPGAIKTEFYSRSMDLIQKEGLTAYQNFVNVVLPAMMAAGERAPGPEVVAQTIYRAVTDGKSKIRYPVGSSAPFLLLLRRLIPEVWFMGIVRRVLERK